MRRPDGLPHDMFPGRATRFADPLRLDDETASRLLDGMVDPADAPPGYAPVAALLTAAAAPARPVELAGPAPTLAAASATATQKPRRARSVRLVALVGVSLVVLGGVAAAATGSLPGPAQSVAHDALGAVGVSVPTRSTTRASAPTRRSRPVTTPPRRVTPHRTAAPTTTEPHRPVGSPPHRPAPPPRSTPRPRPTPSTLAATLCRAAAGGRLSPTGTGRADRAYQALVGLAHGAANIPAYCRGVLG